MIGKLINNILTSTTGVTSLVTATSIFPYIINENTPLPAITYTINTVEPFYSKDGWAYDKITFSVVTYCADYAVLQSISTAIREAFEWKKGTHENIDYLYFYLEGMDEGFNISENVYMNRLTFHVTINGYK